MLAQSQELQVPFGAQGVWPFGHLMRTGLSSTDVTTIPFVKNKPIAINCDCCGLNF